MQREAEQRAGQTPGGLTQEDLGKLNQREWETDQRAAAEREESRAAARRREQQRSDHEPPAESIIDDVEAPDARGRIAEAFGGERRPLVQAGTPAQNRAFLMRMASLGMALVGLFLLWQALQSQTGQVGTPGGGATSAPATTAPGTPLTQASPPVSGTATANASFTKVSGPCNLAARFNDRYSFMATNGALTLTQLSNNHVSRGTISPNGDFTTMAEGQGYRGTVSGTMARGQHTYTAQGCNEVYDFTMTFPTAFIGGAGQQANRPPEAGAIRATQTGTTTSYTVLNVSDPDGDPLRYQWTSTNPCGPPTGHSTPTLVWPHPHPPCPEEGFHPATITVRIDDGRFAITRSYTGGSAPGTGTVPTGGAVTTIAPSPTVAPPTATATAATATAPAVVAGTSGVNIPLILIALVLLIGALGLWFGGPLLAGGPVDQPKKNCDEEKAEEERTRREMERKRAEFDSLNQTRSAAQHAESEATKAEAAARASVRGTASSVDRVTNETIWGNDARSQAAKRAHDAAQEARDEAGRRRGDYDRRGGDAAWQTAKDASDAATRAHDAAAAALAACLESLAPPPTPPASEPEPAGGGATTTGGGTTAGGGVTGGQTIPGGTPGGTMTRPNPCPDQPWRIVSQTDSPPIHVADMSTTKISLNADRTSYIDLEAALGWARRLRLGGKAANQATRLAPDVRSAMGPMGPLLGFTGTMTDAALDSVEWLGEQLRDHFRGGTYSVIYTRHTFVLHCVVKETCSQGVWTRQPGELTLTETVEEKYVGGETTDARNLVVGGRGTDIPRQVNDIMIRLFNELAGMNRRAEAAAKAFEERCRGGQ